ncbi:hypothetical protein SORBI_3009G031800 [Sorghum bicolor]|uniref:Uncharacterized protein n=1 Tax=Sorghum bicolor TaxID=4558 RepID=A0A1B6P683_SORBI|nr:hypothetical protein SORBI_3009G031800 [Sorghum bicolor]
MANDDSVDDKNPRSYTTKNSISDNKMAEVFGMVSVHDHQYKMATFAFQTIKTITEASNGSRLRAQASMVDSYVCFLVSHARINVLDLVRPLLDLSHHCRVCQPLASIYFLLLSIPPELVIDPM